MSLPVIAAARGAAFSLEFGAAISIMEVGIGLAKDVSTTAGASTGAYRERAAVV